jgi:hypothetical protein
MKGSGKFGWAVLAAAVLLSVAAAVVAYNAGVADGIATGAAGSTAAAAAAAPGRVGHGYRPWGIGIMWPLLWLAFWFVVVRGLCFRRHYWCGRPWGRYAGYGFEGPGDPSAVPPAFDEWHRRAHERAKESGSADDPGRRG